MRTDPTRRLARLLLATAFAVAPTAVQAGPGSVRGSVHDLSTSGGGAVKSTVESQICVFCHTPHNADPAPQLWNHQTSGATVYTAYGSSSFDSGAAGGTYNTFPGTTAGQPTGSSRLCLSCHDGTIALGATVNDGTLSVSGPGGDFVPATASLGTDLSNDHPVSFTRNPIDLQVVDPPPGDPVHLEPGTRYVQCVSCHDAHEQNRDPLNDKFLVRSNEASALCTTCHRKAGFGWSWANSPHSLSGKSFTAANSGGVPGLGAHTGYATVAGNGCESCHRAHTAPGAERLLKAVNERDLCFQCHGDGSVAQKALGSAFSKPSRHPLESSVAARLHDYVETSVTPTNFSGARRHVDCSDCHNPHGAANAGVPGTGLHTTGTNVIGPTSVLAGVAGVEPTAWPVVLVPGGTLPMTSAPQSGYAVADSAAGEYQICFKCHSSYAFGLQPPMSPSGGPETDVAAEFNPSNPSYHPVVGTPHLRVPALNLLPPWNTTGPATRMYCSDCHGSDERASTTVAEGPHGSINPYLLRFSNSTWNMSSPTLNALTGFCFNCHDAARIRSTNNVHGVDEHRAQSCQSCHVAVPHGLFRPSLIALAKDPAPYNRGAAKITRFRQAATPQGYQRSYCYSTASPCHAHADASFAPIMSPNTYY